MKTIRKIWLIVLIVFMLAIGFFMGDYYGSEIKINTAISQSLEKRTVEHLKAKGFESKDYTLKTVKAQKFVGINDYAVAVQFSDEAENTYYYSEDTDGKIYQSSRNGQKHIE
ncbi:hypothetical protein [Paenibacillus chitinolyticus]|uniref:hypothetical protein n=1 Tax=Paenibacillus chitinolyticus TaxID=79263 RepID=UPI003CFD32AB